MGEKPYIPETGRFNGISVPTVWNGIAFRSRLEARWAIFFDSLSPKLPYEYEPELIDTPFGKYLPDFWLPTINTFWIVKGEEMSEQETNIVDWLCQRFGVLVMYGPIPLSFNDFEHDKWGYGSETWQQKDGTWYVVPDNPICFTQSLVTGKYGVTWSGCWNRIDGSVERGGDETAGEFSTNIINALWTARNHRFDRRN